MFQRVALPSIGRVAESDSRVALRCGYSSIQVPYNDLMDEAAGYDDLEAVVLLHQDLELLDDKLLRRVRPLLADPRVGVVGAFGGRAVPVPYWTESEDLFGMSMTPTADLHHSIGAHEVEVVDGSLLVLAPWVVRTIRFSDALAADFHGYDVDFCLRIRAAGGRVVCGDIAYFHHMQRPWSDPEGLRRASALLTAMWDPAQRPAAWAPAFQR